MAGLVRVGRIGRPHGIRGEVTVTASTDDPETRFAVGSELVSDPPDRSLTVASARRSGPVFVVGFEGVLDRNGAESLRGTVLAVSSDQLPEPMDDDEFYDHQLIGLTAAAIDGRTLGTVVEVMHPPAAPVLVIRRSDVDGAYDELVPFVRALVPEVDLSARRLVVDPPDGMFA